MLSTMQERPLTVASILTYGVTTYPDSKVFTYRDGLVQERTYREIGLRAAQLAHGLESLGIGPGDRVGTFCFNHAEHLEAYHAVASMGAVLHTLNVRLFVDQLKFVINDAEDTVILCDAMLLGLLERILPETPSVRAVVVIGEGDGSAIRNLGIEVHSYEILLAGRPTQYTWPEVDERSAAAMCYTSGTTGNPKGVVYSHRSTYLHSLTAISASTLGITAVDRALVIVPMFHANAWGLPYAAFLAGADLVLPTRHLQAEPLVDMIQRLNPTMACGVPTIWNDVLRYCRLHPEVDLSCLRLVSAGGSAVPQALIEEFSERFDLQLIQGWGMTETSPVCTLAIPPPNTPKEEALRYLVTAGRAVPGVETRICDLSGEVVAHDGMGIGELEVRGPWITGSYYHSTSQDSFHDGWLRTGDMATIDSEGYVRIVDRTKDVIKSGGEWISSVELENALMAHPKVFEASVISVPDPRWDERPMACIVVAEGEEVTVEELLAHLEGRVAKWWLPERWSFVTEIPKTSVGKFDKKVLRAGFADGDLEIVEVRSER